MSRSYHITRKESERLFRDGDVVAAADYAEKRHVKQSHKKFRKIYEVIRPGAKQRTLRNSVSQSAVKRVMKPMRQKEGADA